MKDKEILKRCHDGECICDGCERRFVCWTTKRIFSNPIHQALYEAYIAEGLCPDEAREQVKHTIERAIIEAETREANRFPKPDIGTPKPYEPYKEWNEWTKDEWKDDEWKDHRIIPDLPHFNKWITGLPADDAKKEMKDLTQYFRSMISGKSNKV